MHVAALHDGNEGGRLSRPQRMFPDRFLRATLLLRVDDREAGVVHGATGLTHLVHRGALPCAQFLDIIRDAMKFLRADDEIDVRHQLKQFRAARLRHAAKKTEDYVRSALRHATKHSHFAQCLLLRHVAEVLYTDISLGFVCGSFVTTIEQKSSDRPSPARSSGNRRF